MIEELDISVCGLLQHLSYPRHHCRNLLLKRGTDLADSHPCFFSSLSQSMNPWSQIRFSLLPPSNFGPFHKQQQSVELGESPGALAYDVKV